MAATSSDEIEEQNEASLPSPRDNESGSQIRLSRTTSTQTDLENTEQPTPVLSTKVVDVPEPDNVPQVVVSTDSLEVPARGQTKPVLSKRTSKWAKQKMSHPEDGWDDNTQINGSVLDYGSSVTTVRRVALPARMVQLKPAPGGSWLFAKTFVDADFAAAGKLSIPPYSTKEEKSTRDNTYVFYVIEGAVEAKIHQTRYVLAPGGMFMVPRGNHYSIANICDRMAKLVFFQSRQVMAPTRETDDPIKLATESSTSLPHFPTSKATILLGLILERLIKLFSKYRTIVLQWYLKTSFNVARHMTQRRTYLLFFILGFFLRRLPFTGASRIKIQIVRPSS